MRRRTERNLTQSEVALWVHVARSVRPLSAQVVRKTTAPEKPVSPPEKDEKLAVSPRGIAGQPMVKPTRQAKAAKPAAPPKPAPAAPAPAAPALKPLAPLERRLKTQLRRGIQPIEAVIDLHGMRQDEAHGALVHFLRQAQAQGAKLVLVVTGKGGDRPGGDRSGGDNSGQGQGDERGVLRRMTPHWLRLPDLRGIVAGFDEADHRHGGSGALYVRLRRRTEHRL
jgi:DNA-nicking Smr family endonuclease